jgi:hypothetical protein
MLIGIAVWNEGSKINLLPESNVIFDLFEAHEKRKRRESSSQKLMAVKLLLQYSKACHEKIGI